MTLRSKRAAVLALAATAAVVGVWAAAFPLSIDTDFPSPGRGWVSRLGPYNEHVVRDVGGLYLALLVLSLGAWRRPSAALLRLAGGAWLVFNTEHLLWHCLHLDAFPAADAVGNVVSLGAVWILSLLLLLPERAGVPGSAGERQAALHPAGDR